MGNCEMNLNRYPKYKPTGIAWLPEVPEGWEVRKVRQLLTMVSRKGFPEKQLLSVTREQGVVVRDVESKEENHNFIPDDLSNYKLVEVGDFVINKMKAWQGSYGVSASEGIVSPAYYTCKLSGVDRRFFSVAIRSKAYVSFFAQLSKGIRVGQWDLSPMALKEIPFLFPPLATQQSIVAFLDEKCGKIDRWVAAKEREVALLKELEQAMIAEAVTGATKVARTDTARKMKPSGIPWLPEVPEGWEVKKVRQHFRLRSEKVSEQDYPPLSVAKVGVVPQLADVAISMAQGETRKLVREGDYVVNSRSDRKGSCGIAPQDGSVTTISIVLEPRQIDRQFVHYLFRSTPWVEEFYRNGRGIVADLWTTRYQEMRNMVFPLPPLAEQRAIVAYIEARAAKIDAAVAGLEREIAAMKEYKQRLIADVVTGQRKVA